MPYWIMSSYFIWRFVYERWLLYGGRKLWIPRRIIILNSLLRNSSRNPRLFYFPWLYSPSLDLGRLTYRRFLKLFIQMVGLLGRVISPSQGLYIHRTTQHRRTRDKHPCLSGIRTHDLSNHPAKTHASDRTAIVTGKLYVIKWKYSCSV
jgi:hypothetical protein